MKGLMVLVTTVLAVTTLAIIVVLLPLFVVGAIVAAFLGALVGIFLRTARSFLRNDPGRPLQRDVLSDS